MFTMQLAIGVIDGENRSFSTPTSYVPGSVRAFSPLLQTEVDVTELGVEAVELAEAPRAGDVVYLGYWPV